MGWSQQSFLSLGPEGFHQVAYTDWGEPANSHVVLCVHGLSRNARDFDRLAGAFQAKCRVVCMDVVGRGASAWLDDKAGYSFQTYLGDAAALIARITAPVKPRLIDRFRAKLSGTIPMTRIDWVGTSMGGLIGMLLAAKSGSPIRRLVMNDVGPFVPWSSLIRLKGHIGSPGLFASLEEVEAYVRRACASFGPIDDGWWRHLTDNAAESIDGNRYQLRYDPHISRGMPVHLDPELSVGLNLLRGIDLWSVWDQVQCPVLILRGTDSDVLTADVVAEMVRLKPSTSVVEFPGVGHAPSLSTPDQIQAIGNFLLAPDQQPTAPNRFAPP